MLRTKIMNTIITFIGLFLLSIVITSLILLLAFVIIIITDNGIFNFRNNDEEIESGEGENQNLDNIRLEINREGKMLEVQDETLVGVKENLSHQA